MKHYIVRRDFGGGLDLALFDEPTTAEGEVVDGWELRRCTAYQGDELRLTINTAGFIPSWSYSAFDVPILDLALADALSRFAGAAAQIIPATLDTHHFGVLNILACVDCIDDERTDGQKWPTDSVRHDKAGKYRAVITLRLDPAKASGHHLFRPAGWEIAVVVSDDLATVLRLADLPGIRLIRC